MNCKSGNMESFRIMDRGVFAFMITIIVLILNFNVSAEGQGIGLNYGMQGNNLPTPEKVIALVKSRNIQKIRLFDPNPDVLKALEGSGIELILGTLNQDLSDLASDPSSATNWVNTHVVPYADSVEFRYINAGNEAIPGESAESVLPAIKNLDAALRANNLSIPVTTAVHTKLLGASFPPSQGAFSADAGRIMAPITAYLEANDVPLLVNVYPYFAYARDPENVRLDYAIFTAEEAVVTDGSLEYFNLFDAIIDSMYSALEKVGVSSVEIVVAETGWPSAENGYIATSKIAQTYNNNLIAHVKKGGTPKRPVKGIETYIFAIFNENQKLAGTEQNFGLYHPDMTEVYHVNF